jgi:hypothetical protein
MVFGSAAGLALFLVNAVFGWTHIHFLYVAPILAAFDVIVLVAVSRFWPAARTAAGAAPSALGWHDTPPELAGAPARRPLWQDYRIQALLLVMLTAAIVVVFR